MRTFYFRFCTVREWPQRRYLETSFVDGAKVPAAPQDDVEQHATAIRLGYKTDLYRMVREHELMHHAIAELRGQSYSRTLWSVAHPHHPENASIAEQHEEEAIILAVQLYLNTGAVSREMLALVEETGLTIEQIEAKARRILDA